jgi:hypothetical protein
MATNKALMGIGAAISIIGLLLLSSITVYHDSMARTLVEVAVKLGVLTLGAWLYRRGQQMRDAR